MGAGFFHAANMCSAAAIPKQNRFPMSSKLLAQMFASLVKSVGGVDAACAAIEAATGECSRGTISKIQNGHALVPMEWAWALQDATGNHCFDTYRARLKGQGDAPSGDGYMLSSECAKEHGEAVSAGIKAEYSGAAGNHADAAVEHREAEQAHARAAAYHEQKANVTQLRGAR